jgi:FCP1-like phosphatase family protein
LTVDGAEAQTLAEVSAKRLKSLGKLKLVLDIDNTLLECSNRPPPPNIAGIQHIVLREGHHWLKLRPGVEEFLRRAAEKYEMTLYTNGKREYAVAVARVLGKDYFGARIVSTPDDVPDLRLRQQKSLERLFPGSSSMVLIMDDREDVWADHEVKNLLLVRPYHYFKNVQSKEQDSCPQLVASMDLLDRVHAQYFNSAQGLKGIEPGRADAAFIERSTATALHIEQSKLLQGCRCVFSGVFPLGTQVKQSREWAWVTRLGGSVSTTLDDETTHVVALNAKTEKAVEGRRRGLHVVHLDWLWFSVWYGQRACEVALRLRDNLEEPFRAVEQTAAAFENPVSDSNEGRHDKEIEEGTTVGGAGREDDNESSDDDILTKLDCFVGKA